MTPIHPPPHRLTRASRGPATPKEDYENKRLLKGYLIGQICNVAKVSVWWTAFTPLVFALLHSDLAVGANRIAFNVALLVLSPIAGVVAERVATRYSLGFTIAVRDAAAFTAVVEQARSHL